jgi:nucleoid DNA-binding protein
VKIEQVIVHYLLKNKELTLQGIGTFKLDAAIPDSSDSEKVITLPENAVSFQFDPKATEDAGLIDYIVEHSNKIKSLAASDLDSFLSLGRQFLNIGKPFTLHNLGTLEKISSGELVFKGGQVIAQKVEPQRIKNEDESMTTEEENMFNEYQKERKTRNAPKIFFSLLVVLILAAIFWAIWHYIFSSKDTENLTTTESIIPLSDSASHADSTAVINPVPDSTALKNPADTFSFKIVVNEYRTPEAALVRLEKLKSFHRNVIMYTHDSVIYKIAEPFSLPLSDTTKMLNSLRNYYSRVYLER